MKFRFLTTVLFTLFYITDPVYSAVSPPQVNPDVYSVKTLGVKGDGVTNDSSRLSLANDLTGRQWHFTSGTYRLADNLTLNASSSWLFSPGTRLRPSVGRTLTLPETIEAGPYQIFDLSQGGTVLFSKSPSKVFVEWFGAKGDGSTNDSVAIQAAVDAVNAAGGGTILFNARTYRAELIRMSANVYLEGSGNSSLLQSITSNSTRVNPVLIGEFVDNWGTSGLSFKSSEATHDDLTGAPTIEGMPATNFSSLILIRGSQNVIIQNSNFSDAINGIVLHASQGGARSNNIQIRNCSFKTVVFGVVTNYTNNFSISDIIAEDIRNTQNRAPHVLYLDSTSRHYVINNIAAKDMPVTSGVDTWASSVVQTKADNGSISNITGSNCSSLLTEVGASNVNVSGVNGHIIGNVNTTIPAVYMSAGSFNKISNVNVRGYPDSPIVLLESEYGTTVNGITAIVEGSSDTYNPVQVIGGTLNSVNNVHTEFVENPITEVSIDASSNILSSNIDQFSVDDVGKVIRIVSAGVSGADLITTVSGFTNIRQITLTDNASLGVVYGWGTIGSELMGLSLTSGTPNLTTTIAGTFSVGDVGKVIRVREAGTGGRDLLTTISGFVNGTSVTLANNGIVTVSGVTGTKVRGGIGLYMSGGSKNYVEGLRTVNARTGISITSGTVEGTVTYHSNGIEAVTEASDAGTRTSIRRPVTENTITGTTTIQALTGTVGTFDRLLVSPTTFTNPAITGGSSTVGNTQVGIYGLSYSTNGVRGDSVTNIGVRGNGVIGGHFTGTTSNSLVVIQSGASTGSAAIQIDRTGTGTAALISGNDQNATGTSLIRLQRSSSDVFVMGATGLVTTGGWLRGSNALDFSSIAAGATAQLTITVSGAVTTDVVSVSPTTAPESGLMWSAYVSGADTVTVRLANVTGAPIDPVSCTYAVRVFR